MADIKWDAPASLMRVTDFATADTAEALIARGTAYELVGMVLDLPPAEQKGLLLRQSTADDVVEHDSDAIRELAARPEYTSAHGAFDTADLPGDPDRATAADEATLVDGITSGPSETDAKGRDGEK